MLPCEVLKFKSEIAGNTYLSIYSQKSLLNPCITILRRELEQLFINYKIQPKIDVSLPTRFQVSR